MGFKTRNFIILIVCLVSLYLSIIFKQDLWVSFFIFASGIMTISFIKAPLKIKQVVALIICLLTIFLLIQVRFGMNRPFAEIAKVSLFIAVGLVTINLIPLIFLPKKSADKLVIKLEKVLDFIFGP